VVWCLPFILHHPKVENMIKTVKTNLFWFVLVITYALPLQASQYTPAYIEQYKTIVINEMARTGIPASIKMAQAILESGSGRSTLARQSNNHFGIKCGKNWTGNTVYREDDDYKNGLLIRSCFRAYDDPADSFMAHSDFLQDNRRYAFLFELGVDDYKGWARGLKKAGYATDPNYPKKLINLIEKYQLYNLDMGISTEPIIASAPDDNKGSDPAPTVEEPTNDSRPNVIAVAKPASSTSYVLEDGYYTFRNGDKMTELAAQFSMPVKELYFRNRLPFGVTPKSGQKLAVSSYIHFGKEPATESQDVPLTDQDYLFEETITISSL